MNGSVNAIENDLPNREHRVFDERYLMETITKCINARDYKVSKELLIKVASLILGFDADGTLVAALIAERLAAATPPGLDAIADSVDLLERAGLKTGTQWPAKLITSLELIIQGIVDEADDEALDRLLAIPNIPFGVLAQRCDELITRVYLPMRRWDAISRMVNTPAFNRAVDEVVWNEIWTAASLPRPSTNSPTISTSDLLENGPSSAHYDFEGLRLVIQELQDRRVSLPRPAISALEKLLQETVVPASFLRFLDGIAPRS